VVLCRHGSTFEHAFPSGTSGEFSPGVVGDCQRQVDVDGVLVHVPRPLLSGIVWMAGSLCQVFVLD
jgi:hypothetical protein